MNKTDCVGRLSSCADWVAVNVAEGGKIREACKKVAQLALKGLRLLAECAAKAVMVLGVTATAVVTSIIASPFLLVAAQINRIRGVKPELRIDDWDSQKEFLNGKDWVIAPLQLEKISNDKNCFNSLVSKHLPNVIRLDRACFGKDIVEALPGNYYLSEGVIYKSLELKEYVIDADSEDELREKIAFYTSSHVRAKNLTIHCQFDSALSSQDPIFTGLSAGSISIMSSAEQENAS